MRRISPPCYQTANASRWIGVFEKPAMLPNAKTINSWFRFLLARTCKKRVRHSPLPVFFAFGSQMNELFVHLSSFSE